eukprot:COSAG06_NODE_43916_length_368_cov_0.297398_1_plen_33_part_01
MVCEVGVDAVLLVGVTIRILISPASPAAGLSVL